MKTVIFVLLIVGMIHCQASQLQVIQAINFVRANPKVLANWFNAAYISQSKLGVPGDLNCYQEAFNYYSNAKTLPPFVEDAGADMAAYNHAKDQVTAGTFNQNLADGTLPQDNLKRFGMFTGGWFFSQMAALFSRSTPVPANDVVMLFAAGCGDLTRKYRSVLASEDYTQAGVGVYNNQRSTQFTVILLKGFVRAPITNDQLNAAVIDGNGMYTGSGQSWPTAVFRPFGTDVKPQFPQIHTLALIDVTDDSTGELGTLVDDKSVACPQQINHLVYGIKDIKAWTKTSQTCKRGTGDFITPDFLDRKVSFAQGGKCYQRFRYCGGTGAVFVYDRQYKTAADANKPLSDVTNELLDGKGDATTVCPSWINPALQIRIVTNWYLMTSQKCTVGANGYLATGLKRDAPFAKKGRCYHRQLFCDTKNQVWAKDAEYVTYSTWAALNRK